MSEVKTESGKVEGTEKLSGLKQKSVRGGKVMMGSQGITVAVQLVSTVILARILTPEDYGIFAMVTAITAFAGLFRDLGLSSAAIQKKGLTTGQQSNLFWLNVLMGAFLTVLIAGCAPLVARFYGRPDLVNVTLVLSLNFIIISLGTQHGAMLVRRMQFGRSSAAMIAGALATLGVSVFCGLQGYAYWSLVWGTLAGAVLIGTLQKSIEWFNPSNTLAAQTYMILFIILFIQFRPRGIVALKGRAAGD